MIALSTLTRQIQNGLNAIGSKEFAVFTDVGEFRGAYRGENSNKITRYVNGIMEAMSPTRLPMKNLQVITQSFRVSFVLDVALLEKDENGEYIEVQQVREVLEQYIKLNNGKPYYLTDSENNQFEITPTFSGITVGMTQQLSPLGETLPMYLDFSCVFVQGGVNTNTVEFLVNGKNMFYQHYSMTRTRTSETNMVANEKSSKTLAQANGVSLNLAMPLIDEKESLEIEDDVYNGTQNQAICVERYRANAKTPYNCYIMIYGNNSESGALGQNVGQVVDFAEGKQNELNYGEKWTETSITTTSESEVGSFTPPSDTNEIVIFWGDGKSEHKKVEITTPRTPITHTYAKVGTYKVRYFKYDLPTVDTYTFNFYANLKDTTTIGGGTLTVKVTGGSTSTTTASTNWSQGIDNKIKIDNNVVLLGESSLIVGQPSVKFIANANEDYKFVNWEKAEETITTSGTIYIPTLDILANNRNHNINYRAYFDEV